jgi:nitroreductase
MELYDAIRGRWATRSYTPAPVDRTLIQDLIEAAVSAPSAMNEQPWDFCVVQDAARRDDISRRAAAYVFSEASGADLAGLHAGPLNEPHFNIFYHAPVLVVISAREGRWTNENAALAAENLMLAAYDRGLGSCWIGLAQWWLRTDAGKAAIGCPADFTPVAPIILGHPAARAEQAPRRPPTIRWLDQARTAV